DWSSDVCSSDLGSLNCTSSPCIIDPSSPVNCTGNGICFFTNGNIAAREINHLIHVTMPTSLSGQTLNDGSGYKVILSSTRGRLFSFFYPWPVTISTTNTPGGNFVSNIGPLSIYFDYKSFNFTQGAQTVSQSAFCVPSGTPLVFWVRIANNAMDSSVILKSTSVIEFKGYGLTGAGLVVDDFIDNKTTVNHICVIAYNYAQTTIFTTAPSKFPALLPL